MSGTRLSGKVALVTGGASGIGLEIARRFTAEGARVAVLDRNESALPDVLGLIGDAAESGSVESAMARIRAELGPVDILVNNAWGGEGEATIDVTDAQWEGALRGTLTSAFVCTRAVLPDMVAAQRGAIVNIASVNAVRFSGHDGYSAAKAGLLSLTRSIAARHGRDGVRANAIVPGTIVTPAWNARAQARPKLFEHLLPYYPLGRLGTPADVASAVVFLASDEASWITGAELPVDGGLLVANGSLARIAEGHDDD